jgi:hypothetical protein
VWPTPDISELRRRLDVGAHVTDASLQLALDVAQAWVTPRLDPNKAGLPTAQAAMLEGTYQLAVKVWDTGARGMVSTDALGDTDLGPVATSGMWRGVLGVLAPALTTGGLVVG